MNESESHDLLKCRNQLGFKSTTSTFAVWPSFTFLPQPRFYLWCKSILRKIDFLKLIIFRIVFFKLNWAEFWLILANLLRSKSILWQRYFCSVYVWGRWLSRKSIGLSPGFSLGTPTLNTQRLWIKDEAGEGELKSEERRFTRRRMSVGSCGMRS